MEELLLMMVGLEHSPEIKAVHFENSEGNEHWLIEFHNKEAELMTSEEMYNLLNVM